MKKMLSMILALMLMVTPILSMAATPAELMQQAMTGNRALDVTLSFDASALPGDDAVTTAVRDLFSSLSLHTVSAINGQYNQFQLLLGGKAVLTNEMTMGDGKLAIRNDFFSAAPLTLAKEDVRTFLDRVMKLSAAAQGSTETPDVDQLATVLENALSAAPVDVAAAAVAMQEKNAAFLKAVETLFTEGETVEALDTAGEFTAVASGKKVPLTADVLKKLFAAMMEGAGADAGVLENLNQMLDKAFADVETAYAALYYTADNVPVLMDVDVTMKADSASARQMKGVTGIKLLFGQSEVDGATAIKANVVLSSKDYPDETFQGKGVFVPGETKSTYDGVLTFVTKTETKTFMTMKATKEKTYGDTEAADHIEGVVDVYERGDGEKSATFTFHADNKTAFDGKDAVTDGVLTFGLNIPAAAAADGAASAVPGLNVEGLKIMYTVKTVDAPTMDLSEAQDVGKMEEADLNNLLSTVSMTAMGVLGTIMQAMPASVTQLIMPSSGQ